MDFTTDKLRSLVRKWQTLIEAHVEVKTTDGYYLRMFAIAFTKKRAGQVRTALAFVCRPCCTHHMQLQSLQEAGHSVASYTIRVVRSLTQLSGVHMHPAWGCVEHDLDGGSGCIPGSAADAAFDELFGLISIS